MKIKNLNLRLLILTAVLAAVGSLYAISFPTERMRYKVYYHFGIINKEAGHALATASCVNDRFAGSITGSSIPWGGRVYMADCALSARMALAPGQLFARETVTSKEGKYMKPTTKDLNGGKFSKTNPACYLTVGGQGRLSTSNETMEAIGIMSDMIAMFYYAKQVNFDSLPVGKTFMLNISNPQGTRQFVNVTYQGVADIPVGSQTVSTWRLRFEYSYHGQRSSYPVECCISRQSRVPVYFGATIKIGKVEMIYAG